MAFTVWLTDEALRLRVATLSQVSVLEGEKADEFYGSMDEIVKEAKDLQRNEKGEIAVHGVAFFAWTRRV
jgi:hypothetical protein